MFVVRLVLGTGRTPILFYLAHGAASKMGMFADLSPIDCMIAGGYHTMSNNHPSWSTFSRLALYPIREVKFYTLIDTGHEKSTG